MVKPHLLYRISHNGGAVFAEKTVAHRIDAIQRALSEAKTWGEFRRMLPKGEWKHIVGEISEHHGDPRSDSGDDIPRWDLDETPFNGFGDMPGVSDGDYPPWLQQAQDKILPADILKNFAKLKDSVLNGSFWQIDEDKADQVAAVLRARGYMVERADNLQFW
jgi:hypothetical protein